MPTTGVGEFCRECYSIVGRKYSWLIEYVNFQVNVGQHICGEVRDIRDPLTKHTSMVMFWLPSSSAISNGKMNHFRSVRYRLDPCLQCLRRNTPERFHGLHDSVELVNQQVVVLLSHVKPCIESWWWFAVISSLVLEDCFV